MPTKNDDNNSFKFVRALATSDPKFVFSKTHSVVVCTPLVSFSEFLLGTWYSLITYRSVDAFTIVGV